MGADREFFFGRHAVGYFEDHDYPSKDGEYRYMPYRGKGHYDMGEAFRATGRADCWYVLSEERVAFAVVARPEYGLLRLSGFARHCQP